jgi:hypothetical protein
MLFPKQAAQLAELEKQNVELFKRFDELYDHLDIHRAHISAQPEKHELRKGRCCWGTLTVSPGCDWSWGCTTVIGSGGTPKPKRARKGKGAK